jgi:hypothetical protein
VEGIGLWFGMTTINNRPSPTAPTTPTSSNQTGATTNEAPADVGAAGDVDECSVNGVSLDDNIEAIDGGSAPAASFTHSGPKLLQRAEPKDLIHKVQNLGPGDSVTVNIGAEVHAGPYTVRGAVSATIDRTAEGRYQVTVSGEALGGTRAMSTREFIDANGAVRAGGRASATLSFASAAEAQAFVEKLKDDVDGTLAEVANDRSKLAKYSVALVAEGTIEVKAALKFQEGLTNLGLGAGGSLSGEVAASVDNTTTPSMLTFSAKLTGTAAAEFCAKHGISGTTSANGELSVEVSQSFPLPPDSGALSDINEAIANAGPPEPLQVTIRGSATIEGKGERNGGANGGGYGAGFEAVLTLGDDNVLTGNMTTYTTTQIGSKTVVEAGDELGGASGSLAVTYVNRVNEKTHRIDGVENILSDFAREAASLGKKRLDVQVDALRVGGR